jgi:hypothetical protein
MEKNDPKEASARFAIRSENVQGVVQADEIKHLTQNFGGQTGGIRAGRIVAENVVDGVQITGADAQTAESLIRAAKDLPLGSITADDIRAKNLVSGVQFQRQKTENGGQDD